MKYGMFWLNEIKRSLRFPQKNRVGFILNTRPNTYNRTIASTRLRVYDIITAFNDSNEFFVELYKPWKTYNLVIFHKIPDESALERAMALKRAGTKVVLDINYNYFDKRLPEHRRLRCHNLEFVNLCDALLVSSPYLKTYLLAIWPDLHIEDIPEPITDQFFSVKKTYTLNPKQTINLLYCGYAAKANEINLIRTPLESLTSKYNFQFIFICDYDPELSFTGIRTQYLKYDQRIIHRQLLKGDLFISPRDLNDPHNLARSFTKIGLPMAVGIPVLASPVPSYQNTPAILIQGFGSEWASNIEKCINDKDYYLDISTRGRAFCRTHKSLPVVKNLYKRFFRSLL